MTSFVNLNHDCYIIAEIGQNHCGDVKLASEYIKWCADAGVNAVKFQTRDNKYLFSEEAYKKKYNSNNAFASTYGEHREILELTRSGLSQLREEASKRSVDFISTPFDEPSLQMLMELEIDALKVASFDIGNLPFLSEINSQGLPVIMSTGGANLQVIQDSIDVLNASEIALLHCVSEYPCPASRLSLPKISEYRKRFPKVTVGSSDHFSGILSGPIAYMLGARVFEKHVTHNRSAKGTDHSFALEKRGLENFIRDLNRTQEMLLDEPKLNLGDEPVFKKLGKSIIAKNYISQGTTIQMDMLSGKIFSDLGIPVRLSKRVLGKVAKKDIFSGQQLNWDCFEDNDGQ